MNAPQYITTGYPIPTFDGIQQSLQPFPNTGSVPPVGPSQDLSIQRLENSIASMEDQHMTSDPRYAQMLHLKQRLTGGPLPAASLDNSSSREPTEDRDKVGATATSVLNPDQLNQLKAQVGVYKQLARQEPVNSPMFANAVQRSSLLPEPYEHPGETENGEKLPYDLMKILALHQQRAVRCTTLPTPPGIDPQLILKEREHRIHNRIGLRIKELSNLPVDISEKIRIKAEIELRALRLLNLQNQIRAEVLSQLKKDTTLETALNPYAYRRTKRQNLREARVTEKLEKQQKLEQERRRRQKHNEFLQAILQHGKDFKDFHRNIQVKISKIKKAVLTYHANSEKERKKDELKNERMRMQKLMQEDEEGYRQLLDEKKDKRLVLLLQQTDEYIDGLTGLVKQHQATEKKRRRNERRELRAQQQLDDSADVKVHIREIESGRMLRPDEVPKADEVDAWLEAHPGHEVVSRDEASDSEESDPDFDDEPILLPKDDEYEG
ncbi:hypothetical protein AB6A40_004577 [Gnathostoma spinigerum]|uniref:Uncharacterized protein n=1 Tax=Gnathostoma spinigerum TaxID=75299 RepID=A0ABD6ED21_9BILA